MLHLVSRTAQFLSSLTESVSALLLGAIVVINLLQVLFRYVIGAPLGWTEEVMRYSVVWLTFLASVAALHRGEHMVIDVLGTALPRRLRRLVYLLVLLCIAAFCWILVAEGFPLALRNAAQFSPSARIPMILPYGSVAVGGVLLLIQIACLLVLIATGRAEPPQASGT
ncbi:MAG TPA: TRAP transporter small permease [Geminicoccaceae bacterium]|nr:TRAP transporter small permease [Geminicoccaceae bacterium]